MTMKNEVRSIPHPSCSWLWKVKWGQWAPDYVWNLVEILKVVKAVRCKLVYKTKHDSKGMQKDLKQGL